jgi:DNA-binding CsgD family transcriptional regulator
MNTFSENKLIGDIYDAALNPGLWRNILVDIRDRMGIDECTIVFYDAQCRERNFADSASGDDDQIKLYLKDYIDAEMAALDQYFNSIPIGAVTHAQTLTKLAGQRYEKLMGEDYCDDLLTSSSPKTLEVLGGIMLIHGKIIAAVVGFKSFNTSPTVTEEAYQFAQRMAPHMMQAIRIHNHITSLQTTYNSLYAVLNAVGYGVFLLGKLGEVLFSNNEAARMIETNCGLAFAKGGVLQHIAEEANAQLQKSIRLLLEKPTESHFENLNLALAHTRSSFPLQLNLLPIHHEQAQHFATSGASIAVFVKDPNKPLSISAQYLKQAYQLTYAEIEVAQLLLNNLDTVTIADQRHTNIETIRGHVKHLMQKTKTHSKVELVSLLAYLCSEI